MVTAGQHPDRQSFVVERRGGDGGALAGASARTQKMWRRSASATTAALTSGSSVAAITYQAPSRSPSRNSLSVNVIPPMASTAGVALRRDDMHVGAVGHQQRQPPLRDRAAADDDDLLAGQTQADEIGVLGHPASLEVAAAATKREIAWGCAAGWVCR